MMRQVNRKYTWHICNGKGEGKFHTNYSKFLKYNFEKRDDCQWVADKNEADYCDCPKIFLNTSGRKIEDRFLSLAWFTKKNYLARILADTDFYPKTYFKKDGKLYLVNDLERPVKLSTVADTNLGGKWFIKPNFDHSGNRIMVVPSLKDAFRRASNNMVIQRGIEPKLIGGRKFDLRLYALGVVDMNRIRFYLYEDGYCRLSSYKYNKKGCDKNSNLTNICIHIKLNDPRRIFIMYKEWNGYEKTFPRVLPIARELFSRMGKDLERGYRGVIVMGLDVLVDIDGKPWILEINNKLGSKLFPYSQKFRRMHYRMYNDMIDVAFMNKTSANGGWKFLTEV